MNVLTWNDFNNIICQCDSLQDAISLTLTSKKFIGFIGPGEYSVIANCAKILSFDYSDGFNDCISQIIKDELKDVDRDAVVLFSRATEHYLVDYFASMTPFLRNYDDLLPFHFDYMRHIMGHMLHCVKQPDEKIFTTRVCLGNANNYWRYSSRRFD